MREVPIAQITAAVRDLLLEAAFDLGPGVLEALQRAYEQEVSPLGKEVLAQLIENARVAREERIPLCQDTGLAVVFIEVGQEVRISGGDLMEGLNEGVRQAYQGGYLRRSVCHPLTRENTGDNTPAVVHTEISPGDRVRIRVLPKGGGSENMSKALVLPPWVGREGLVRQVIEWVREAGPNPCPPVVLGVGIGGTLEGAALMAKKALLRPLGTPSPDPDLAALEAEILKGVNALGIGPQGYGGRITCLGVHVEMAPCHIASLPLALNIQCHAHRWKEAVL